MTDKEAMHEITSQLKFYIGSPYSQQTASALVKRFREKRITTGKLEEFLNAFGYVKREGMWIKIKMEQPNYQTK